MELNPNLTQVLIQLGIYLFLIFILKNLYFEPLLALIKRRESLTSGRVGEADSLRKQTEEFRAKYDSRMLELRDVLDRERSEALKTSKERIEKKIAEAKLATEQKFLTHQKEIQAEGQKLRAKLPELSMEVSKEIVSAITTSRVVRA